jgi:hypothetical protein
VKSIALYNRFRSDIVDVAEPQLWSKEEVWGYMEDAQNMFCRLTWNIRDVSSEATRVAVSAGEPFILIHPSIMAIRHVTKVSTGESIPVYSWEDMVGSNGYPKGISREQLNLTGPLKGVIIGIEDGKLRATQVPEVDDELELMIERLPLCAPSATVPLEIRDEHHLALLLWMKHLAYAKQDSETLNEKRSGEMAAAFVDYCELAMSEKRKREHKPRLMAYGGY